MSWQEILILFEAFVAVTAVVLWKHEQKRADDQQDRKNIAWQIIERRDKTIAALKGWKTRIEESQN